MKKVVAFLLALIIFVAPVTTLVKADVVIGDNDETIINENATILGRKLALLESLSDLALSGVTEFTISNTNDVDSYLDSLWNELSDAIDSLSDGTGFTEISNNLKSKYYTNLLQYKDYITNRGTYLAQMLPSGSPTTTLLSTFFANNIYGKQTTQHYDLALDMFKSLSALNQTPTIPDDIPSQYQQIIDKINLLNIYHAVSFPPIGGGAYDITVNNTVGTVIALKNIDNTKPYLEQRSFIFSNNTFQIAFVPFLSAYIDETSDNYEIRISPYTYTIADTFGYDHYLVNGNSVKPFNKNGMPTVYTFSKTLNYPNGRLLGTTNTLTDALNLIYNNYAYINIYVNGELWSLVSDTSDSPILDIDGLLKIFGNDNPVQYELQPNTQIDYDELYTTIYNAIRDNLPISQGDINYYDSHDTIYSPTIINNYGEEEGDESDLIDTILDYAVIPKFDTAIAQPMRQALTNGVVIMNTSITDVIPNEILLILGACFFLLLFAVVINRMIK